MKPHLKTQLLLILALCVSWSLAWAGWSETVKFPDSEKPMALFNGRDLSGWQGQVAKYWSVEQGTIRGANKEEIPTSTYLLTEKPYRNFRLIFEVKQTRNEKYPPTTHSAVAALGERIEDRGDPFGFKGPLLMFCHDWGIWDVNRRNRVYPPDHPPDKMMQHPSEKVGDWNQIEVLVVGNRIRMVNNGQLIIDFTDKPEMLRSCPIGLQLHSNEAAQEYLFRGLILSENPQDRLLTLKNTK